MNQELIEKKQELKSKILTIEWDKNMGKMDFSKDHLLELYKKQLLEIEVN